MEKIENHNIYKDKMKDLLGKNDIRFYVREEFLDSRIETCSINVSDGGYEVKDRIISLPSSVFDNVSSYQELENMLETNDKERFNILKSALMAMSNYLMENEDSDVFRPSIAGYFASKSMEDGVSKAKFAASEFTVLTPYNNVLDTVMAEIAQVIKDVNMCNALLYGPVTMLLAIDEATKKKGLGQKFINSFEILCKDYESYMELEKIVAFNDKLESKLQKIMEIFKNNYTYCSIDLVSSYIFEYNDFSLQDTFTEDKINPNDELTESEKVVIRKYLALCEERSLRFRESRCLAGEINGKDCMYKLGIVFRDFRTQLDITQKFFLEHWRALQKLILTVIMPLANKATNDDTFNVDKMLDFCSYENSFKLFTLEENTKVKKLSQKLKSNYL